jgi:outer membrane protein OmpA-like peptidoglycan-associated protein
MKLTRVFAIAVTCCLALPLAAMAGQQAPGAGSPAAKVQAISFPPDKSIDLDMKAMSPMMTSGRATVTTKGGTTEVEATFRDLGAPSMFGPEYLVYVLWAVTPEGKVANLGTITMDGTKGEVRATTRFQAFALGVTAEPHFAVTMPSDTVVLANEVPDKKNIHTAPLEVKADLQVRGRYKGAGLQPARNDSRIPLEFYEARNAVKIAEWQKAKEFASDTFMKAADALKRAEAAQADKKTKPESVIMAAREAVQIAEESRGLAVKRSADASIAADQKVAADREAAVRAEAQARTEAANAKAAEAQAHARSSAATAASAEAQAGAAVAAAAEQRANLLLQLNRILATKDTGRGLVVTMADVTFASNSATLQPSARESLSRLAGVLALTPGLKLSIEGYTDNVGGDDHNQMLSEKRATAVRDYLAQQGISANALAAKGLGEAMPVATNDSTEGRAKNRRVEIIVSGDAIGTKAGE